MASISSLSDEEVDELLAGRVPDGRRELAPVAEVAHAVRERAVDEPAPVMRYPLRHAVARRAAPLEPCQPRRLAHAAISGALIAVIAVGSAANALPAPVQEAVADVGDLVGVEVPHAYPEATAGTARAPIPERGSVSEAQDEETGAARPPEGTPGGATPAEPGTPGDLAPATPAIPPEPTGGIDGNASASSDVDQAQGDEKTGTPPDEAVDPDDADDPGSGNAHSPGDDEDASDEGASDLPDPRSDSRTALGVGTGRGQPGLI